MEEKTSLTTLTPIMLRYTKENGFIHRKIFIFIKNFTIKMILARNKRFYSKKRLRSLAIMLNCIEEKGLIHKKKLLLKKITKVPRYRYG